MTWENGSTLEKGTTNIARTRITAIKRICTILEFRLGTSKSAIAARVANVYTRTATVAGDQL